MTLNQYIESLGIDPVSPEADALIAWALDVDDDSDLLDEEEDFDPDLDGPEMLSDDEVLEILKLCVDSDPDWRENFRASLEEDGGPLPAATYEDYLRQLGIELGSDEEIHLIEKVFDITFDEEELALLQESDEVCGCGQEEHPEGEVCSCGARHEDDHAHENPEDLPEITPFELLKEVHRYVSSHPDWREGL